MPQRDPRASPPDACGDGCAPQADGGHRARQPVQPRPPDLDAPEPAAARPAVPARALSMAAAAAGPVLVLYGPTGAGKTDWAVALTEHLPAEIVSVDSALVYRGLDIGTAKPSAALRARIPHHLIDLCDAAESYSAGRFV